MPFDPHQNAGLYIHIPFCTRKCPYCDFYSISDLSGRNAFLEALAKEMEIASDRTSLFDTLYIGGGTPSVLDCDEIGQILGAARHHYRFTSDPEITIEVNPGTVEEDQLRKLRQLGIDRITIGVQSFQPSALDFLERIHSKQDAYQAIQWARNAGFENLGIDLIYGLPGQTKGAWLRDLQEAVGFQPEHLSCYILTYAEGTPMLGWKEAGRFSAMDEAYTADLFRTTVTYLQANGYDQYEVSNFEHRDTAGGGTHRSKHNLKYWTLAPYVGLGPSAHSFRFPIRHWNVDRLDRYEERIASGQLPIEEREELTRDQELLEWIYLGLRQTDGIPVNRFNAHFDTDFYKAFGGVVDELHREGMMVAEADRCCLTTKGLLLLDSIVGRFAICDF